MLPKLDTPDLVGYGSIVIVLKKVRLKSMSVMETQRKLWARVIPPNWIVVMGVIGG